jgi:hypothetical protein
VQVRIHEPTEKHSYWRLFCWSLTPARDAVALRAVRILIAAGAPLDAFGESLAQVPIMICCGGSVDI